MSKYDWDVVFERAEIALETNEDISTWTELGDALDVPRKTLTEAVEREGQTDLADILRARRGQEAEDGDEELPSGPFEPILSKDGNTAVATSCNTQIKSPEQLIEALGIDRDEWIVGDATVKTYDGWRGDQEKEITWKDGRIVEGYVRDGGILTKTLYSVQVKLYRRNPEPIMPTFSVIEPPLHYAPPPNGTPADGRLKSVLFSDVHMGYLKDVQNAALTPLHNRKMLSVILQVCRDYQPDFIGILGDWLDMPRWTKGFIDKPEYYWTTQPSLFEGNWWLSQFRIACPDTRIILIEGNHDERLRRYTRKYMIEAEGLRAVSSQYPALSLPHLMGTEGLGVEWVGGYEEDEAFFEPAPGLRWMHGNVARKSGGATVRELTSEAGKSVFAGHSHRSELQISKFKDTDRYVQGCVLGCTCHLDGRIPGGTPEKGWQNVFAVTEFSAHEGASLPNTELIPFLDGKAYWRGQQYRGSFDPAVLRNAFPGERWNW
jgi:hypothetical protein